MNIAEKYDPKHRLHLILFVIIKILNKILLNLLSAVFLPIFQLAYSVQANPYNEGNCLIIKNICVSILPPSDYVLQALAGTTFPERLKPMFVFNFHRCVGNNYNIVQDFEGVFGSGGVGVGSGSDGWGGCEDATTSERIRWSNEGKY